MEQLPEDQNQITHQEELSSDPTPFQVQAHSSTKKIVALVGLSIFAVVLLITGYLLGTTKKATQLANTNTSNLPVKSTLPATQKSQIKDSSILYTKLPDRNDSSSLQAWIFDLQSNLSSQVQLPFPISSAFKHYGSTRYFFKASGKEYSNTLFSLDLVSEAAQVPYTPLEDADPEVIEWIGIQNLSYISPDNTYFVFDTFFTIPCEESNPPGIDAGSGPCQPEDSTFRQGYYLYSTSNNQSTYLAETVLISKWDLENNQLYFIDNRFQENGLFSIDLNTREIKSVHKASTFGYGAYLLDDQKTLVLLEAEAESGGNFSRLQILDLTSKKTTPIDSGVWAELQPFLMVSPNEDYVVYEKQSQLFVYSFATQQTQPLTTKDPTLRYGAVGEWISDTEFTTLVDTNEEDNYYNGNNYIVKINVETLQLERLTPNDDVFRYYRN